MKVTLKHLIASRGIVQLESGELSVRGLTLTDIAALSRDYSETLAKLVDAGVEDIDWKAILLDAPEFCHVIIAKTTGGTVSEASQVPIGIQIKILIEAWNQTAIDPEMIETAVKKFLDLLGSLSNRIGLQV